MMCLFCATSCVAVCCSVLQFAAVCCSVLHVFCSVLHVCCTCVVGYGIEWGSQSVANLSMRRLYYAASCVAVCRSVLQCVAVCCSVSQCIAVYCSVLKRASWGRAVMSLSVTCLLCAVLQCVAVCCSVMRWDVMVWCTAEHPLVRMRVCKRVRVCGWCMRLLSSFPCSLYEHVYEIYMNLHICIHIHALDLYMYIYIYMLIYVYVYVYICI